MARIEWVLRQVAVEARHASLLLDPLKALDLGLKLVDYLGRGDLVDLVQIANSALDDFYQDQCLDDGVSCCADPQILQISLGQDAQRIAQIFLDLALGRDTDLVLSGLNLGLGNFFVALQGRLVRH